MKTSLLRVALTLTVAAATATAGPTTALAAPATGGAQATVPSEAAFGDPPLPSYPGLDGGGAGDRATAAVGTTPIPCDNNGSHKTLTRSQVVARAQSWLNVGGIPYSQNRCYRNSYGDYRTDCSGFVSMAWGLGGSGSAFWTGNLGDVSTVIPRSALKPGDALLRHENNPSVDHVALFLSWEDAAHTRPVVIEQTGSSGTIQRTWSQSNAANYTPVRYDHILDGGVPDLGVFDFFLSDDPASSVSTRPVVHYGNSPMVPIVGDWNGDGLDTVSAYDPASGQFFVSNNPATGAAEYTFMYGNPGAVPLVGDWDGDGKDNVGVRMDNRFFLRTSPVSSGTETTITVAYGDSGDIPLIGDWDGDGKDNVGVHKPGDFNFYLRTSANTDPAEITHVVPYGNVGATPLVGDWNGDGKDNVGVRMGNVYYFRTSEVNSAAETTMSVAYGNGDPGSEYPIVGDWNGDNKDTQGIVY
ncbi:hypothetical protein [Amycolatopsis sp. DG1A-15b]|uniref:hypothetical protein n=1 Tax=Amycolatopsis sp. DG1A-15b TaxID=3052846 RepID=UPI00255B6B2D|nr:hypothetical protein [Amycolatopsis sp. DG1A-15b]WIX90394.1 hypothetical protein QRY02_08175 [Amycolatopsis sp. DG1A-15b]